MSIGVITILLFAAMIIPLSLGLPLAFTLGGVAAVFAYTLWGPNSLYGFPLRFLSASTKWAAVTMKISSMANDISHMATQSLLLSLAICTSVM